MGVNIKILVAYHKDTEIIKNEILLPIQVGRVVSNVELNMVGDDTGENISYKNPYYCEMTAVYWAWKNLTNLDYVGLCHYRRFFTFESLNISMWTRIKKRLNELRGIYYYYPNYIFENGNVRQRALLFQEKIDFFLKTTNADLIATKPAGVGNVYKHYLNYISKDHIELTKEIISEYFSEYSKLLDKILTQDFLYAYNMFLMKIDLFDKYCEFIFNVLQIHEQKIIASGWCQSLNEGCFARVSGFISELMTHVFICKCKEDGMIVEHVNFLFKK